MSVKHLVVLFIFFFNATISVFADSFHIEIETHSASVAHSDDHHNHAEHKHDDHEQDASSNASDHCPDHDECHSGHFHHYLTSNSSKLVAGVTSANLDFPCYSSFYSPNYPEVIKPPIVLA